MAAFDAHRTGSYAAPTDSEDGRRCLHPIEVLDPGGEMRLEPLTEAGECRMYAAIEREVTIWTLRGLEERRQMLSRLASRG